MEVVRDEVGRRRHLARVVQGDRLAQVHVGVGAVAGHQPDDTEHLVREALRRRVVHLDPVIEGVGAEQQALVGRERPGEHLQLGCDAAQSDGLLHRHRTGEVHHPSQGRDGLGDVTAVAVHRGETPQGGVLHLGGRSGVEHRGRELLGPVELTTPRDRFDHLGLHVGPSVPDVGGEVEGLVVEGDGSGRGDRHRLVRGPHQPPDRVEVAGLGPAGELTGDLLRGCAGASEGLRRGSMEVASLGGQHVAVHGVAHEVVAERQAIAVAGDQPGQRRLPQPRGDVDHRASRHGGEVGEREARPEQAGEAQQLAGLDREPRQAPHQRLVQPARDGRRGDLGDPRVDAQEALVVEGAQQLGDEQRVAPGGEQPGPQLAARRRPGDRRAQRVEVDLVERAESQVTAVAVVERVDHPVHRRRARRGPQGHHDAELRRPRPGDERSQHRQRQVVGPVRVLDDQQRGIRPRQRLDRVDAGLDDREAEIARVTTTG